MSLVSGLATAPDLLRLVAVPVFGWAALRDLRTRRVPNRTWAPLLAVGVLALLWDAWLVLDAPAYDRRIFLVRTLLSVGFVAPLGYVFWRLGGFGGADAKAVITLAVVFPVFPTFYLETGAYPMYAPPLGVFSLTILSNTVLVGLAYPLVLALRNLPRGSVTPAMFVGRPVRVEDVTTEYGRLLETPSGFTRRGLDIDALRMYLRWRGVTFGELLARPDRYRHPLPTERNDPGDGSIAARASAGVDERSSTTADVEVGRDDGGTASGDVGADAAIDVPAPDDDATPAVRPLDEWGADRFLEAHSAYGTTPADLRTGLETLVEADRRRVWITPGIPFIVPMFVGLCLSLAVGDVLYALLGWLGLA